MTAEAVLTADVLYELKQIRKGGEQIKWLKIVGNPSIESGTPDLLIVYRGVPVFAELKAKHGRVTKLQAQRLKEWREAGAVTGVCRSVNDVLSLLESTWS